MVLLAKRRPLDLARLPVAEAVKGRNVFQQLMANPLPAGQSDAGPWRKNCGKPPLATELGGSSGVLIDRRRWSSNPDQQSFCCIYPLDRRAFQPSAWLSRWRRRGGGPTGALSSNRAFAGTSRGCAWAEQLTATTPIDTTIDVCASTGGSIAGCSRCRNARGPVARSSCRRHSRSPVSRCAVIGPGPVNRSRNHDGGRCDHDTSGWHDDAGTLIGVVPATADELAGIDTHPSQSR